MQWYVLYTEWGQVKRRCFGDDEVAARKFAETEENAKVRYGLC